MDGNQTPTPPLGRDTTVSSLTLRLESLLSHATPQARAKAVSLLQRLVETVEADSPSSDLLSSILRRTQSSVKATAQHSNGNGSGAVVPRTPVIAEGREEHVEGLFDPVTMLRKAAGGSDDALSDAGGGNETTLDLAGRLLSTPNVYDASAREGLSQFKKGFLKFKREVITTHSEHFRGLAAAQSPKVMVIACCDSRVDPALLMGAGPGDIFTVRNIANLVPPFERQGSYHGTSAALEYAVCSLKVEHIIVLGHQHCGGIKALMSRSDATLKNDFIDKWMEIAATACERTRLDAGRLPFGAQCSYCERESVNVSLQNLLSFPWIKDAVARRALQLHGWYYNMEEASMSTWKLRYQITEYEKLEG